MADISRIEPTHLPNGLWLDGNEYASENVEESSGVLSLESAETDGYRVGPELDLGAISDVGSSKLEWSSTGDVEVLAAVSEVSAQGSLRFDEIDDLVDTGFFVQYTTGDSFTYSIFFNTNQTTRGDLLYIGDSDKTGSPLIAISHQKDSNELEFMVRGADGNLVSIAFNGYAVNDNEWHMATLTVDSGTLSTYVDGVFNSSASGVDMNIDLSDTTLLFGYGESYYGGLLYGARVYIRDLSAQEIADLFDYKNVSEGIDGYWPLDDGLKIQGEFTDPRDGNVYNYKKIGNQVWMTENLKYLPEVSPSSAGSNTEAHYYVYGYQGTSVEDAKNRANYDTYGVLYNWPAAVAENLDGSDTNPSGLQGVCPVGWHLPSDEEFKELEMYLGLTQEEADDTGFRGGDDLDGKGVGSALAKAGEWIEGESFHLSGHERYGESGFDALSAGNRSSSGNFDDLETRAFFWSSQGSSSSAWRRGLRRDYSSAYRDTTSSGRGFSVRCLRDYVPPDSTVARDVSGNNNEGAIIGATFDPNNPKQVIATNGQAIPGVSVNDDLTGKKLYTQQRFSRATTGDPSPTLTELKATVEGAGGALPLINGGLIRSAHTQNNTMIR